MSNADYFVRVIRVISCFSFSKVTIFPVPHADILNLPVPHHVRCA